MLCGLAAAGIVMLAGVAMTGGAAPPPPPPKVRIGTYDSRAVAVAYARSAACAESLKALQARLDQAVAKDEKGAKQRIARAADRRQWLAHRQAFGRASVDDAMGALKDNLAEVARQARVEAIVYEPDFASEQVELVDLTAEIVALFEPDERTRKMAMSVKDAQRVHIDFDFED
jgi:hypothetical protein